MKKASSVYWLDIVKGQKVIDFMIPIQKIIFSRDVIFNEEACWNWESNVDVDFELDSPLISYSTKDDTTDSPPRRVRSMDEIYASCEFACFDTKPTSFEDVKNKEEWVVAMKEERVVSMKEELAAIEKNKPWSLVDLPKQKEAFGLKWVYKPKFKPYGTLDKNKARLVVKVYAQI